MSEAKTWRRSQRRFWSGEGYLLAIVSIELGLSLMEIVGCGLASPVN